LPTASLRHGWRVRWSAWRWRDHDAYQKTFPRLLRDRRAEGAAPDG
jgi:hypothetical protein